MNRPVFTYYQLALWPLLLLGMVPSGWAQSLTLRGTITDQATGDPLAGASITAPALRAGTYAGTDGAYTLRLETTGRPVEVRVSYAGYEAQVFTLDPAGGDQRRDLALTEEGFTTEDVVITATKGFEQAQSDVTVSIEVVKPAFIDLQAVPSVDKVISQIPGVDNQGGQINIRGSSGYAYGVGSRVMVTLDGLPLLTGDAGTPNLDLIPVDNIAQIEVMKGASSVLYGSSALGGVISIITADPGEKPLTSVRVRGGLFGQPANPALDWDGDATPWSASAHLFHARRIGPVSLSFQTNFIKESGYRRGTDAEISRSLLMLKYRPKHLRGLTLGLNASVNVDSSGQILYWHSYYPGEVVSISNDTTISDGALTPTPDAGGFRRQLNIDMALDPSIKYLTANGSLFWYRGRYLRNFNQNNTNQSSDNFIFYNDFLYQTTLAGKVNWVTGVTYTQSGIQGDSLYGGTYVYEGDTISSAGSHAGYSLGVYTQLDAKLGRLNASLGFRYEQVRIDDVVRENAPVFRAGLNYKLARGTNVRASFGQAFRVPSIAERFANTSGGGILVEPNPAIGAERGYSAEVGLRQGFLFDGNQVKLKGYLDLAGFVMNYDNMVEFGISSANIRLVGGNFVPDVRFSSVNVAAARIPGVELTGGLTLNWGTKGLFALSGGVTYLEPRDLNAVPEEQQLNLADPANFIQVFNPDLVDQPSFLKYRSRWTVRASGTLGYGPVSLTANYRYKSFVENIDQYLYIVVNDLADFRARYPQGDHVIDLITAWQIIPNHQLSLTVDNVLNREYLIIPGFLAPQRKFTLQYLFRF